MLHQPVSISSQIISFQLGLQFTRQNPSDHYHLMSLELIVYGQKYKSPPIFAVYINHSFQIEVNQTFEYNKKRRPIWSPLQLLIQGCVILSLACFSDVLLVSVGDINLSAAYRCCEVRINHGLCNSPEIWSDYGRLPAANPACSFWWHLLSPLVKSQTFLTDFCLFRGPTFFFPEMQH
jgi:hypothetical protein